MRKFILSIALAAASALAWALPSLAEVETQLQQGHYAQAESMMREVVAAKPSNARAHYVYAEILAHDGKFAAAADEARLARQLDPDIKFTSAEKFSAFEALLQRQQGEATRARAAPSTTQSYSPNAPAVTAPAAASAGIPSWVWLGGLAVIAFLLWRGFSRSRASAAAAGWRDGRARRLRRRADDAERRPGGNAVRGRLSRRATGQRLARPWRRRGRRRRRRHARRRAAASALRISRAVDPGNAGQAGFFDSPQGRRRQ